MWYRAAAVAKEVVGSIELCRAGPLADAEMSWHRRPRRSASDRPTTTTEWRRSYRGRPVTRTDDADTGPLLCRGPGRFVAIGCGGGGGACVMRVGKKRLEPI